MESLSLSDLPDAVQAVSTPSVSELIRWLEWQHNTPGQGSTLRGRFFSVGSNPSRIELAMWLNKQFAEFGEWRARQGG